MSSAFNILSSAFNILHLHPTTKHMLCTEFSEELLHPSFRLHIGCSHPHLTYTYILELWVRPLK